MTGGQMPDIHDRRIAARTPEPPLTPDRIEQLRARIEAGAYSSDTILQATARAILERRDL